MSAPRMTAAIMRAAIRAVKRAGGSRVEASRALGIALGTLNSRLINARRVGMAVPPSPARATQGTAELRSALAIERKRVEALSDRLDAARAAGRSLRTPTPLRARTGKDDRMRIIFPDLHGCYQDAAAVAAFLGDVKRLAPDEVIGLGDIVDAGGFLAQHHTWGYVAESAYTFEDDIRAANGFLDALQGAAPRASIELIEGNHEARVERWCVTAALRSRQDAGFLMARNAPDVLLELKRRGIQWFRRGQTYDNLPIQGTIRRGKVCFTHAAEQRTLRRFGTNVVHGHTHRVDSVMVSSVASGTVGIWSLGCLSQKQPLWQHGAPTDWVHAYGIQIVARSGAFLHFTVPIIAGRSLLPEMRLR